MQPDSVGGNTTSVGSESALIKLVRPNVNLTELHSLNYKLFPSKPVHTIPEQYNWK